MDCQNPAWSRFMGLSLTYFPGSNQKEVTG